MFAHNNMNTWPFFLARNLIVLLTFLCTLAGGWDNAQAALLDGLMGWAENPLSERLAKKGERLTVGNFYTPERPDSHGPIGVMGDHTHNEGEFMMSFRFMYMDMDGNRNGTTSLSPAQVLQNFAVAPTDMQMRMYMFSAMYGFNNTVTLMAMLPYVENSMNHVTRMGGQFETESGAIGDVKLSTLWRLWAVEAPSLGAHRVHLNIGVSLPSGDIQPRDGTPLGVGPLPYPMRLGSGTVDFLPGLTYTGQSANYSWGLQGLGTHRIGTNKQGYSQGNNFNVTSWVARRWSNWFSTSIRFNYRWWDQYSGADKDLLTRVPMGPMAGTPLVQTADPLRQGGQRLDVMGGVNFLFPEYKGIENRIAVEGGVPIYQDLAGPQLETDWLVWAGFQFVK